MTLVLASCSTKPKADADALASALVDIAALSPEVAQCAADDISENADYTEFYVNDDGTPDENPPSLDKTLEDLGDGTSDVVGLVDAFEQDVAEAVTACSSTR